MIVMVMVVMVLRGGREVLKKNLVCQGSAHELTCEGLRDRIVSLAFVTHSWSIMFGASWSRLSRVIMVLVYGLLLDVDG